MNQKNFRNILAVASLSLTMSFLAACSGSGTSSSTPTSSTSPTPAKVMATGGATQSEAVGSAFSAMQVTVLSSTSTPVSGVTVTFTAPSSGASCAFQSGTTLTATTNANGIATSGVCTANATTGAYAVTGSVTGVATPASFSLTNTTGAAAAITVTSGSGQNATAGKAFGAPLIATVTDADSNPVSGLSVTFTAPATGASGTFQSTGSSTETDTTNASGVATSSTFTANSTTGTYTVMASANSLTPASFNLSNSVNFVFFLKGDELANSNNNNVTSYYTVAGAISLDSNGDVLGGEEDYNDGDGITSPGEPNTPDTINALTSALMVDPVTGQGTLTLNTNNPNVGVNGTETLGVQFVNASHALIIQFDGSATSSGSLDLQTSTTPANQGFAFAVSGTDLDYYPEAIGGVFTLNGSSVTNGIADFNDAGTLATGSAFTAGLSTTDSFGRGTIAITSGNTITYSYYVVGPEAMRLIDVDTTDTGVGSAFGQGTTTTFTNASLGSSVFGLIGIYPSGYAYSAAGQFGTLSGTLQGVGDCDEEGNVDPGAAFAGTYSVSNSVNSVTYNGYGSLNFNSGSFGDISALGLYMTDPNLNLQDPNNPVGGGGALLVDFDGLLAGGTGFVIPQTDTSATDFASNYAFGAQDLVPGFELDFVGQASVSNVALTGVGLLNEDWNDYFGTGDFTGVSFSGSPTADTNNTGRYMLLPLVLTANGTQAPFTAVVYQASGTQLLLMTEDNDELSLGSFQQQGSLSAIPAARTAVKVQRKK